MTISHGFELLRDEIIEEVNSRARIWRHIQTGAELLSMENDDENKVFGIAFRTPPEDSTGIAHIMEHSVLGGSRKYQVKEPFVELVKGSLNTFLNAFTSPDKTTYPVASTNLQDFYNLVDVYLDAVFYPLITPHHLQQEGWHYELENSDDPLIYKGVVFNEMKGNYSSPDYLLGQYSQTSIFPDTVYREDAGGDPKVIPDLTYKQFKNFHETYYHPSNAYIYFYGDDDPEERLRLLDVYLRDFEKLDVDTAVALQSPFSEPIRQTFPYSVDAQQADAPPPKAMVQLNWMLMEYADTTEVMALSILSYALLSTPASPLRKALLDSGLGEDITGGGLSTHVRQMTFEAGLKGVELENTAKVEPLILETLERLADAGLDQEMIEASLNTIEFALRENNTGRFPRGLALMMNALNTWLHDRDPLLPLRYEAPLTAVKQNLAADKTYLQKLIRQHLLENPHRSTIILEPDAELAQREAAAEAARLADVRAGLNAKQLQAIIDNTTELRRIQEAPDSPEDLAALPMLTLADLDRESKTIPLAVSELNGSQLLYHDLFTNGIVYLDVGFNLKSLPQELLPFARLFGRALLEMGTETEDFVKLSHRIGRKTGGIAAPTFTAAVKDHDEGTAWLLLRGKATMQQTQDLLDILRDILLTVKLDNQERFRQIVVKAKAGKEAGLIPSGHIVVNTRLSAHFNEGDWAAEQIGGIDYLFFLRELAAEIEDDWPAVLAKLETVRAHLLNRNTMLCNVTLDSDNWGSFEPRLTDFLSTLPAAPVNLQDWLPAPLAMNEGLTIPAQVNYVGKGANLYQLGYQLNGSVSVIRNLLGTTWLWEKIRVQGGAYGGFATFDSRSGVFNYLSYRDPNLRKSLSNYDGTAEFLRKLELSDDELTKNIIGAIGTIDAYQLPDAKGFTSMQRYLTGLNDADRQQYRNEVLNTTVADFRAFSDILAQVVDAGEVVVLGSGQALRQAETDGLEIAIQKVI